MAEPKKLIVPPDAEIGDVDLDVEVVMYDGERLTEARARQIADETLAEMDRRGLRPVPSRTRIQFRTPVTLAAKAEERAKVEGKTVSALAREALERYLAS